MRAGRRTACGTRGRAGVSTAVGAAVLVALATGCSHHDGAATGTGPAATATSPAPAGTPSGYAEMEKKVHAAESAANAADRDAASDGK